jgi:hypothetical protein
MQIETRRDGGQEVDEALPRQTSHRPVTPAKSGNDVKQRRQATTSCNLGQPQVTRSRSHADARSITVTTTITMIITAAVCA